MPLRYHWLRLAKTPSGLDQVIAAYDNGAAVGSPSREYILASGTRIAKIASGATVYYHRDQVSTRVTTDANGNVLSQQAHYPFGENWYQSGATPNSPPPSPLTTDQQFTMYLRDTESGNDAAPAREFINRLGRFSVVDPMGGNSSNPQSLSRYAYATNDPIDLLDPEGEYLCITWCGGYSPVGGWGEFGMLDYFSGWPNFPTDTGPYNNLATVSNYLLGGLPIGASSSGGSGSVDYTQEQKEADCEEGLRQDNQNSNTVENVLAKYDTILGAAGNDNGLAALVASIGIIESGFQDLDENDGKGVGVGVYQITVSATSGVTAAQANDFTWATNYAVNKLVSNGANLAGAFPNFTPAQLLQATAASWNLGVGGISGNPDTIDDASNGPNHQQDYGSVVLLLMNCFD